MCIFQSHQGCKYLKFKAICFFILIYLLPQTPSFASELPSKPILPSLYNEALMNYDSGNNQAALDKLNEIVERKKNSTGDSFPQFHKVYNFIGVLYKKQGDLQAATQYYHLAVENTENKEYLPGYYSNLANIYTRWGEFSNARTYLLKSLDILENDSVKNYPLIADIYHNISYSFNKSGNYSEAIDVAKKCIKISSEHLKNEYGDIFYNCGVAYKMLDSLAQAEACFKKAISCHIKEYGKEHYITAMSYVNYANLLVDKGDFKASGSLYKKAGEAILQNVGLYHPYTSLYYSHIAHYKLKTGNYEIALQFCQKALQSKIQDFDSILLYKNPASNLFPDLDLLEIIKLKALVFERYSEVNNRRMNLEASLSTLELSVNYIEKLRISLIDEGSKLQLVSKEKDTYTSIIRVACSLFEITNNTKYAEIAFKYAEHSKYSVLRELYSEELAMKSASVPDSVIRYRQNITEQISEIQNQILRESSSINPSKIRVKGLNENLFQKTKALEALNKSILNAYPTYINNKYNSKVIGVDELQAHLRKDQAVFEYTLTDSLLYIFFISNSQFEVKRIQLDSAFYAHLSYYQKFLNSFYSLSYDSFRISTYDLYQTFIQPFEEDIKGKSLLIIPDGKMALISFEALVDEPFEEVKSAHYSFEPYLIRKYPIAYAYSSSLYVESLKRKPKNRNKVLAFAPDYKNLKDTIPELPSAKKYLRRLTRFGGKYFDKQNATEAKLKKEISHYNIIHIIAHGYEDIDNPSNSKILFSDSFNQQVDGLFAYEINNLSLEAKLVVLASCYSGSGKISKGEGVLSIGRSFLNAGASTIIMSLWYASFEASIEQLDFFHKQLLLGKRKDEALRQAKLEYLNNANMLTAHPRYWAGLIVNGNQEPIYHMFYTKKIIALTLILGLIFFVARWLFVRYKTSKQ